MLVVSSALPRHQWHWSRPDYHKHREAAAAAAVKVELEEALEQWSRDQEGEWNGVDAAAVADEQTIMPHEQVCSSAVVKMSVNGRTKRRSFHLCHQESTEPEFGVYNEVDCYYTTAHCCLGSPGLYYSTIELPLVGQNKTFAVKYYSINEQTDVCFRTATSDGVQSCLSPECLSLCIADDPACINNTKTESEESCANFTCDCKPGYEPPDCCKCSSSYTMINGTCKEVCRTYCERIDRVTGCTDCRPGYELEPLCCNCTKNYYRAEDETCQPACANNTLNECKNEECVCLPGFGGPGCCQCRNNSINCTDTECECRKGYAGPDCCDCDPAYYRASNGECKKPECEERVDSCENEKCTCIEPYGPEPDCCYCVDNVDLSSCTTESGCLCKPNFEGDDCCKESICIPEQDIYFLVDATNSNDILPFCQEMYSIELISAALRPKLGGDLSGTRIATYFYPKKIDTTDLVYFKIGDWDCTNTVNQFHRLMRAFTTDPADFGYEEKDLYDLQKKSLRGSITLPIAGLKELARVIRRDIEAYGERRRIVIILTDGKSDQGASRVQDAVKDLSAAGGGQDSLTMIAAGVAPPQTTDSEFDVFKEQVKLLANNSEENSYAYLMPSDSKDAGTILGKKLVDIMENNGALCKLHADEIRALLNNPKGVYYCDCNIYHPDFFPKKCEASCPSDLYKGGKGFEDCKAPPTDACSILGSDHFNSKEATLSSNRFDSKDLELISLEEEIIAAVENVLVEKGIIEFDD